MVAQASNILRQIDNSTNLADYQNCEKNFTVNIECECAFPALDEPTQYKNKGKFKYRVKLLLAKDDPQLKQLSGMLAILLSNNLTGAEMKKATAKALYDFTSLCDGDNPGNSVSNQNPGQVFFSATTERTPKIYNSEGVELTTPALIKSTIVGTDIVEALVQFYFLPAQNKVFTSLLGVKHVMEGERNFGARMDVSKMFDAPKDEQPVLELPSFDF